MPANVFKGFTCLVMVIIVSLLILYNVPIYTGKQVFLANTSLEITVDHHGIHLNSSQIKETCFKLYWNNSLQLSKVFLSTKDVNQSATGKCNRFLTIQSAIGRMGNQMFQLASLFGLACEYNFIPVVPASKVPISKYFDIPNMLEDNMPSTNVDI